MVSLRCNITASGLINTAEYDVDECSSVPCQNGGTCVDLVDGFRCECTPEWEGSACQFDADECQDSPCINAYSCQNLVGDYKCKCQKGWAGKNCDHNINDCVGQCLHGGTCIDLVNNYHCACQAGYTGRHCDTDINECANNPCMNQGECSDRVNGYRCICAVGYIGEQCEVKNDHCINNPCKNEAHCFNTQGDYYCLCSEEWQGKNCSTKRQQCLHPPCEVIDSCTVSAPSGSAIMVPSGICGDHGMCVGLPGGGFRCSCEAGYTGQYCHENINDCKVNPCQNGGTCVDKVSSFQCICKEGWEGEICATNKDECIPNPCRNNGSCLDGIADFVCSCRDGWKGKTCNLKDSHCDRSTCRNGGTCQDLGDTYVCLCLPDWEGTTCHIVASYSLLNAELSLAAAVGHFSGVVYSSGAFRLQPSPYREFRAPPGGRGCNNVRQQECSTNRISKMRLTLFRARIGITEAWSKLADLLRVALSISFISSRRVRKAFTSHGPFHLGDSLAEILSAAELRGKSRQNTLLRKASLHLSPYAELPGSPTNGSTSQTANKGWFSSLPKRREEGVHPVDSCTAELKATKSHACKSNPCQNGATCVNTGDFYSCICKEGFEGQHCQHDINDCNPLPCFNGGKCIDGVNWFLCECAPGFTGPDCRININECASNPCGYGSTCVDDIGQFQCLCPKGRIGVRCEGVEVMAYSPGTCFWNTQYYSNNASWQYECNMCSCEDSVVKCTKVWCGLGNCLGQDSIICQPNQVCVPSPREACLAPPCVPWGECRDLQSGKRVGPPQLPSLPSCWPNQASLSLSCVRLSLYVDRNKLPPGVSIEGLCDQLRILLALHQASLESDHQLVLLCDLKQGYNDTIEATLSSLSQSTGLQENTAVTDGIKVLGEAISRKQTNFPVFTSSVVEVKVETAIATSREEKKKEDNGYFIALICIILVLVLGAVVGSLYYWHNVWRRRIMLGSGAHLGGSRATNCDDEKSNNLQNEENLRRYVANPLKEESVPSLVSAKSSTSVESISDCQPHRVSVVRPLSTDASSSTSTAEMLEVIPDPDVVPVKPQATDLSRQSSPRRNSQILLFKAQSPDVRKNTAAFDDIGPHKDFAKRVINLKVLPSVQRTFQPPCEVDRGGGDMLTVIV
uniref:EGF-like domain-containing protein n=1 Tax=Timema tahoe TaxID=61484 RepID=A0A7R9NVV2_9NEOP|nr:unnamed protein product [Timema tahoe]